MFPLYTVAIIISDTYTTTLERCENAATVKVFVVDAKSAPMMEPIYWEK